MKIITFAFLYTLLYDSIRIYTKSLYSSILRFIIKLFTNGGIIEEIKVFLYYSLDKDN